MKEIHEAENLDVIVYERVAGFHSNALISSAKLVAVIETFCMDNGINYRAYSASEIKKFATGKGNANKTKMVEAAKEKYGYMGVNDNEADALHILHLAQRDLLGKH